MTRDAETLKPRSAATLHASIALIAAMPPAMYFIVGDQSEPGLPRNLDYFWHAPTWSNSTVTVIGATALLVVAISILMISRERHRGRVSRSVVAIDSLLVAAGMLGGWSYRVMTAGVVGANIGAGLIIVFGTPLLFAMLVSALVIAIRSRTRSTQIR